MKIRNQQDFWSGVMFVAFGLFFVGFAQQYDMGTAARMGPAFFPTMLGGLMLVLGLIIGLKALGSKAVDGHIEPFQFRPVALVLGAVILFGLLLRPAGLIVSLFVLVFVSSLGSHEFHFRNVLILTVGMALLVFAVFIYGLSMTIPVWPAFISD